MFLTYLVLVVALALSAVAAFYSIVGLTVIFAAAAIPIIIMGSILEVAKLVVTVWLHEYWHQVKLSMKLYLIPAVLILMFITSMGIFGFLSSAHIEQAAAGVESQAQVERISKEIARQTAIVDRAQTRFQQLQTTGLGTDTNVQSQIDTEQSRIDSAYQRIQPAIDEQNAIIANQTQLYTEQIDRVDRDLALLQSYIDTGEVAKAQSMIGSRADGRWGPATAAAMRTWQDAQNQQRQSLTQQLKDLDANNTTVRAAREEIQRVRARVDAQIAQSNQLIDRLMQQVGQSSTADVETALQEQQQVIRAANQDIDQLTQQQYQFEVEFRKLEAEIGPIKYIAEFVYGDQADKDMLEKSVRWVIVIIVAVFDPLAVMMLLAFTESRAWHRANTAQVIPPPPAPPPPPPPPPPSVIRNRSNKKFVSTPALAEPLVDSVVNIDTAVPDLPIPQEHNTVPTVSFGPVWPDNPVRGYMFLRTDYVPTKLFKFNGDKWIEVDKELTDGYVTNTAYIGFLMKKIESGEYDADLLNHAELAEIEAHLQQTGGQ